MRRRAREKGQVLPLVAIALSVLMGFGGAAVDVGFLQYNQQKQQAATDAAAQGGAEYLAHSDCSTQDETAAQTAAQFDSTNNGYKNGTNGVTVAANSPPLSGPYSGVSCAISVQITTPHVQTFFTRLFGYPNGMPESTQAIATVSSSGSACIYLLSPTATSDFSNSNIDAPNCSIYINNASSNMSTSTIDAAAISYAGSKPNESGATFPEATPQPALPIADPCPSIPGCAYLTNNPPSTSGCSSGGTYNNVTLTHGCYGSLTLTGTDTLNPGLYVINGQFHLNGATVSGSGVTIYMTSSVQDTNFSTAQLTLSACTSSCSNNAVSNVLLYRIKTQSSALNLSTCTCLLSGLLYFPTTQVDYSNTGDVYSVLVFGNANFSTSHALDFGSPPSSQAIVQKSVIVQ